MSEKSISAKLQQSRPAAEFEVTVKSRLATGSDIAEPEEGDRAVATPGGEKDSSSVVVCDPVDLAFLAGGRSDAVFDMRCQISRNGQDFSPLNFDSSSTVFHAFTPLALEPSCCYVVSALQKHLSSGGGNTAEFDREVLVSGESFLPQNRLSAGTSVEVWLSTPAQEGDASEPIILPVTCESFTRLRFALSLDTLKPLLQAFSTQAGDGPLAVSLNFYLRQQKSSGAEVVTSLSNATLSYFLCKESPVLLQPFNLKRSVLVDGPQLLSVTKQDGSAFTFFSACLKARIHVPSLSQSVLLSDEDVFMRAVEDSETGRRYTIQIRLSALESYQELQDVDIAAVSQLFVSVSLDGEAVPAEETWGRLCLHSSLAKYAVATAAPKGGFVAGASVTLTLEDYLAPPPAGLDAAAADSSVCKVRLRGNNEAAAAEVAATMTSSPAGGALTCTVQFAVPPDCSKLDPLVSGKDKLLYVDVSGDGGATFDRADSALLQIK